MSLSYEKVTDLWSMIVSVQLTTMVTNENSPRNNKTVDRMVETSDITGQQTNDGGRRGQNVTVSIQPSQPDVVFKKIH